MNQMGLDPLLALYSSICHQCWWEEILQKTPDKIYRIFRHPPDISIFCFNILETCCKWQCIIWCNSHLLWWTLNFERYKKKPNANFDYIDGIEPYLSAGIAVFVNWTDFPAGCSCDTTATHKVAHHDGRWSNLARFGTGFGKIGHTPKCTKTTKTYF